MQTAASLDVHLNHGGGWIPGPAEHYLDTEFCRGEAPWNDAKGNGTDCFREGRELSRMVFSKGSRSPCLLLPPQRFYTVVGT